MGARPVGRVALLAIHPQYAEAILDGRKHVEFRKRALAPDVQTVLMYATSPVKRIIGEFTIDRILVGSPGDLWSSVGAVGGITEPAFDAYYAGSESAAGILVTAPRRYPSPVPLGALNPVPAVPQSFTYLPGDALERLHNLAGSAARPLLHRLPAAVVELMQLAAPDHAIRRVSPLREQPTRDVQSDRISVSG